MTYKKHLLMLQENKETQTDTHGDSRKDTYICGADFVSASAFFFLFTFFFSTSAISRLSFNDFIWIASVKQKLDAQHTQCWVNRASWQEGETKQETY